MDVYYWDTKSVKLRKSCAFVRTSQSHKKNFIEQETTNSLWYSIFKYAVIAIKNAFHIIVYEKMTGYNKNNSSKAS